MLTAEQLRAAIRYNPRTGEFLWRTPKPGRPISGRAGTVLPSGYVSVTIDYRRYYAHRLAVLYMTGAWPASLVDHRNTIRSDNRWRNLRDADYVVNAQNRKHPSKNAVALGVSWDESRGMYKVQLYAQGKSRLNKRFSTLAAASQAYADAKAIWHVKK